MGNIVSVINALGYEETFSYDLLGRVTEKKDREGYNTAYSYTEAGDIKSIIYNIITGKVWSTPTTAEES